MSSSTANGENETKWFCALHEFTQFLKEDKKNIVIIILSACLISIVCFFTNRVFAPLRRRSAPCASRPMRDSGWFLFALAADARRDAASAAHCCRLRVAVRTGENGAPLPRCNSAVSGTPGDPEMAVRSTTFPAASLFCFSCCFFYVS